LAARNQFIERESKLMSQIVQDFSTPDLVTILEENMFSYFIRYARSPLCTLYEDSDLIRFSSNVRYPYYNAVFRAQLQLEQIDSSIQKHLDYFSAKELPMFWWTGTTTEPTNLGNYLEAKGLELVNNMPVMAIDLLSLPEKLVLPQELTITQVQDTETLKYWVKIGMISFEVPDTEFDAVYELELSLGINSDEYIRLIGCWKDSPVATSAVYFNAGIAGIYFVSTLPEARKKGFATGLVLAALREARTKEYHIATLQASEMGANIYRKLGFQEYSKMGLYLWTGQTNGVI
jgi:GNAT superfamily N-acetyltransferase